MKLKGWPRVREALCRAAVFLDLVKYESEWDRKKAAERKNMTFRERVRDAMRRAALFLGIIDYDDGWPVDGGWDERP